MEGAGSTSTSMLVTPRSRIPQGTIRCEVIEIGGYVEGKAVGGDAARHVDAQGGNFLFRDGTSGHGPDAGAAGRALGQHAIVRTGANEHFFQLAQVLDDAQRRGEAAQMEDGITHQLPWSVIGDVASAVGLKQRDAAPRQQLVAGNDVLAVGIPAQGEHRRMLDQQQHIADALLLAQGADLLLQGRAPRA